MHTWLQQDRRVVNHSMLRIRRLPDRRERQNPRVRIWKDLAADAGILFPAVALFEILSPDPDDMQKLIELTNDALETNWMSQRTTLFEDELGYLGMLFSWEIMPEIERLMNRLTEIVSPQQLNIGIGRPIQSEDDLARSYSEALQAIQHTFYIGTGKRVTFDELDEYQSTLDFPSEQEKELYHQVMAEDDPQLMAGKVARFFDALLQRGPAPINQVYEMTLRLMIGIEQKLLVELNDVSVYKKYEILSVVRLDTLQEIKQSVIDYLLLLQSLISKKQQSRHNTIIKETIMYMEQECEQASLRRIARQVYVTPAYLSQLFKMNTGRTFIEQLTEIRINKAKQMLKNTHLKNFEVASKVGYQDSRYFSQIFKKKVGLTPSEFRKSAT